MTLEEIYKSNPEFRGKLEAAVKVPEVQMILAAIDQDILSKITRVAIPQHGQTYAEAVSNWHSNLNGMRDVVNIIRNIGKDRQQNQSQAPMEIPYEHAIDPSLRPENWGKHPFIQQFKKTA